MGFSFTESLVWLMEDVTEILYCHILLLETEKQQKTISAFGVPIQFL